MATILKAVAQNEVDAKVGAKLESITTTSAVGVATEPQSQGADSAWKLRMANAGNRVRGNTQSFLGTGLIRNSRMNSTSTYHPSNAANLANLMRFLNPPQLVADLHPADASLREISPGLRYAFLDASEQIEVRPDTELDELETAAYLAESVDAAGLHVSWEDVHRYTDYRDLRYTSSRLKCLQCDAVARQTPPLSKKR